MRHPAFLDTPPPLWLLLGLLVISTALTVLVVWQRA